MFCCDVSFQVVFPRPLEVLPAMGTLDTRTIVMSAMSIQFRPCAEPFVAFVTTMGFLMASHVLSAAIVSTRPTEYYRPRTESEGGRSLPEPCTILEVAATLTHDRIERIIPRRCLLSMDVSCGGIVDKLRSWIDGQFCPLCADVNAS